MTFASRPVLALVLLFAALALAPGCEAPAPDEGGGGTASGAAKAAKGEVVLIIEHTWPSDQAYRDITYEIERRGDAWSWNETDLPADKVKALLAATTVHLLPSDGLKSCRYAKSYPEFKITIPNSEAGPLTLLSSSRCDRMVPWNVIKDGKLWMQLDGSIGAALLPLLKVADPPRWEATASPEAGRFEVTGGGEVPAGVEAQENPAAALVAKVATAPAYQAIFGDTAPTSIRILCSQRGSAHCSSLEGRALLPFRKTYVLDLEVDLTLDGVEKILWPEDTKPLDALLASKLFASFKASARTDTGERQITLRYGTDDDCTFVQHAAPTFKPDVDPASLGCALWNVSVDDEGASVLAPMLFFYPSIGAVRLANWSDHTDPEFYKRLGAREKIMDDVILERVRFYATLDGKIEEIPK